MSHILSIEDHQRTREMLVTMIEAMGHTAETADDGQSGVEAAKAGKFDLILMDIVMPGIDGHEAARQIRSAGIEQPIIAVTADAMTGAREKCLDAGMNDYLVKPITLDKLKDMVEKYL
ncbi:response regulator [bacterium]|jgi:CheY-like chemotaxis protein|nr:response regulator [bacterium]MBT7310503.1 response regulator [bacterium]